MGWNYENMEIRPPVKDDPLLARRREEIFIHLGLGLVKGRNPLLANKLASTFDNSYSTREQKKLALERLRNTIIEISASGISEIPTLGNVLGKAYVLADMEDQQLIPELIQQYVDHHQLLPAPVAVATSRRSERILVA